jgi:hypothetical protein
MNLVNFIPKIEKLMKSAFIFLKIIFKINVKELLWKNIIEQFICPFTNWRSALVNVEVKLI